MPGPDINPEARVGYLPMRFATWLRTWLNHNEVTDPGERAAITTFAEQLHADALHEAYHRGYEDGRVDERNDPGPTPEPITEPPMPLQAPQQAEHEGNDLR